MPDLPVAVPDHAEAYKRLSAMIAEGGGLDDAQPMYSPHGELRQFEGEYAALLVGLRQAEERNEELRESLSAALWLAEFLTPKQRVTYECGHGATVLDRCPESCEAHSKMLAAALAVKEEGA